MVTSLKQQEKHTLNLTFLKKGVSIDICLPIVNTYIPGEGEGMFKLTYHLLTVEKELVSIKLLNVTIYFKLYIYLLRPIHGYRS